MLVESRLRLAMSMPYLVMSIAKRGNYWLSCGIKVPEIGMGSRKFIHRKKALLSLEFPGWELQHHDCNRASPVISEGCYTHTSWWWISVSLPYLCFYMLCVLPLLLTAYFSDTLFYNIMSISHSPYGVSRIYLVPNFDNMRFLIE